MQTGFFLTYKRRRTRKEKGSRAERTKCCRTDSELLSLLALSLHLLLHCVPVQVSWRLALFVERPECVLQHLRPVYPFCASRHTGIGICSPPCSFPLVSISCPAVGCNILLCYLFAFISTYLSLLRPSVSAFTCDLCLLGRVPVQSSVLRNRIFGSV